jgi:hypothetical protein
MRDGTKLAAIRSGKVSPADILHYISKRQSMISWGWWGLRLFVRFLGMRGVLRPLVILASIIPGLKGFACGAASFAALTFALGWAAVASAPRSIGWASMIGVALLCAGLTACSSGVPEAKRAWEQKSNNQAINQSSGSVGAKSVSLGGYHPPPQSWSNIICISQELIAYLRLLSRWAGKCPTTMRRCLSSIVK